MTNKVINVTEYMWSFDSTNPHVLVYGEKGYKRHESVDPFPCYGHNTKLVEETLDKVSAAFPIGVGVNIFNLHYETMGRTNGYMSYQTEYDDDNKGTMYPYIVLLGKRIPPHPAMTRYLVSHEYGHVVERWIECKQNREKENTFRKEYGAMRGIPEIEHYGGRTWHKSVGEVIANDFRILCTGLESEFWPHEVPHPMEVPEIIEWWKQAKEKYAVSN
jgi:hypothetical protein